MFKVEQSSNSLQPLQITTFSSEGITERYHLQEWLAKNPQALTRDSDDELLIIQKEFAGFNETKERLDLLAIDKDGNLVIIENKPDDSGRDVVWQTLKYAGYCANLRKEHIIEIFQRYLVQNDPKETRPAADLLAEFLEHESLDEVQINKSRSQRIILVAANFRKEVTNTALWLMQFNIRIQCFKITPYRYENNIFIDIRQVIPTPEAESYMISMAQKEAEEQSTSSELKQSQRLRKAFWTQILEKFRTSGCSLYNNISPSTDHWLCAGSGISGMPYSLIFSKKEIRVELWISRISADINTLALNWLEQHRVSVEKAFGNPLEWLSLPGKKACRIQYRQKIEGFQQENWPQMIDWLVVHMARFENALSPYLSQLNQLIKQTANGHDEAENITEAVKHV